LHGATVTARFSSKLCFKFSKPVDAGNPESPPGGEKTKIATGDAVRPRALGKTASFDRYLAGETACIFVTIGLDGKP
jgi:hypothetical protein